MKQRARLSKSLRLLTVLFSLLTMSIGIAFGQAISGNVVGTVSDASGAVVANAEVTATNVGTNASLVTHTNSSGEYRFDNLPVGTYKITVKATGFRTNIDQTNVELNKTVTRNSIVTPGVATETVEVSAAPPAIDTTTAQLQSTYDPQYAQDLGLTSAGGAGAGVLNLSLLSPGVTNGSAMGDGVGPSVGGQRPRDNNFTVEGVDNNNKTVTGALITVPPESVENFTLLSNQFNSEFGHSSGGQFNTTVKSGTNSFHGSAYEYFRNRNLNAVDQTWVQQGLNSNPRFDANRFGGTIGGPILKNKLFFFTNFERNPVGFISVGGGAVQAPTAAGLAAMGADPNMNATNFQIFQKYVPVATTPSGCITYNGTTNSGANKLGANPFSAAANGSCAAGSVEVGNVPIVPAAWQSWTNFVQSIDYNMSMKDQIRGRFIYNKEHLLDNAAQLGTFFAPYTITFALVNASEYHTFSPNLTNEFRLGFNRFDENIVAGNFSYPGLDVFPNITLFDLGNGLNIGPDGNAPQFTIQNFYQIVDNVSIVKGKHTFKVGAEYRWYISPQGFTQRARGDYEYNATQVYLEDFAPDNFGQRSTGSSTYYGNDKAIYFYLNDTWRVNQHLSLNAGVRYEYTTTPIGENRQTLNSIADTPSILVPQAHNQPLVFGTIHPAKNNWAPRIGLAYSPGNSGNTSIRAGFGMAYDTLYDNIGGLAVPPQIGSTENVAAGLQPPNVAPLTPNFLANGGLPPGGGNGITVLSKADALANTANWIPTKEKDPYSINWNFGIQHSFGKNYTAEVNYVGTRGIHLPLQDISNLVSVVTPATALPTYLQAPDQATLDALPNSLDNLLALQAANIEPANYANAGFGSAITVFVPRGQSSYHGLQSELTRRFSHGLTFQTAYTWSHTIDNSTADFHTSDITPRRPQDFFNFGAEKANSALDRAQRFTVAIVYDLPYFKGGNWMRKNVLGNWTFSPVYTYETGEWVTVQSQQDANLNGDPAGDRVITNPAGVRGTGTDVSPLTALSGPNKGSVVAYVANNPNAQFIRTGLGALPNTGRNTLQTPGTNNIDLGIYKNLDITERMKFRFGAQFGNIINHPQFIPGSNPGFGLGVNDVNGFASVGTGYKAFVTPGDANFNNPKAVFASNARTIALVAKFSF
ncbi:MAG TPA: carboxypeptidase regulatory-like domain-containing protein [Dongiaceae bacterium]|nr:carboxypeptidase regulatory-like domain-containing protein [Dongiaceae bacterium]